MRLTKWIDGRIGKQNDEQEFGMWEIDVIKKLAAYEDAEEQGLLVRLPCKVGDTVYEITPRHTINTLYVDRFEISRGETGAILILTDGYRWSPCHHKISEIGKTVFLTREEAKFALKG